jgi:glycoprotease/Kae1 family metallohydrolase
VRRHGRRRGAGTARPGQRRRVAGGAARAAGRRAARERQPRAPRAIDGAFTRALSLAGVELHDLDAVAATYGPGLAGSLLVGLGYAKALAWGRGLPFVPVHHLAGHVAACLAEGDGTQTPPEPPYLCLIASGGHTVLFDVPAPGRFERLGGSRDDAAGEAFDKVARLLGLPYPGGPALAALAETGDAEAVVLPRPMARQRGFDFSFSGLKTAVALLLEREPEARAADVAAAFEARVVQSLVDVASRGRPRATGRDTLVVAGGVAANRQPEAGAGGGRRARAPAAVRTHHRQRGDDRAGGRRAAAAPGRARSDARRWPWTRPRTCRSPRGRHAPRRDRRLNARQAPRPHDTAR